MSWIQSPSQVSNRISSDWNDFKSFFGSIGSGLSDLWNNITGKTSRELAEKNFNLQQQQFDYQKQLNDLTMEREDTAYQRAVKDANAAGLSSLSVGSGASAASQTSASAPQINDYAGDQFMRGMNMLNAVTSFQNNITQQILSAKRAEAEISNINSRTANQNLNNDLLSFMLPSQKDLFNLETADKKRMFQFYSDYGLFSGADPYEKYSMLNHLSSSQYSDTIFSNQFNKIGLLTGLIGKFASSISNGKIDSVDDLVNSAGKAAQKLGNLFINDNKVSFLPNLFSNKLDFKAIDPIGSLSALDRQKIKSGLQQANELNASKRKKRLSWLFPFWSKKSKPKDGGSW